MRSTAKILCALLISLAPLGCGEDEGEANCGDSLSCDPATQFCTRQVSDTSEPDSFSCSALPDACSSDPSCDCMVANETPALSFCLSEGGCESDGELITVTCPGG